MSASGVCRKSVLHLSQFSRLVLFKANKPCCRRLCSVATENNRNASTEPPPPAKDSKTKADTNDAVPDTEVEEVMVDKGPSEAEKALQAENKKIKKELDGAKDKYVRALAETENVRRRMRKQIDEAKVFGIQGFCKDLLEVADILRQATESTPKDELTHNQHLKNLYEGLTLTNSQMLKVFAKHELHPIAPSEGEKFDPFLHEAMFQVPAQEAEKDGTIAIIQKTGFRLHDRTIRPALVGVFKAS